MSKTVAICVLLLTATMSGCGTIGNLTLAPELGVRRGLFRNPRRAGIALRVRP
jgi:hypothetical protein